MVGAGILADDEDRVRLLEIAEGDGTLADADGLAEGDATGLVAHIRAIGKIVGAVKPDEQLVKKGRFIAGAAGCVEFGAIGMVETIEDAADLGECLLPGDRLVGICRRVIAHRVRQTALMLQRIIAPAAKFCDGVGREEIRADALFRRFPGHGLDAVFAEFERRAMFRITPGAARAIEAIGLVGLQHGPGAGQRRAAFHQPLAAAFQRAPATCGGRALADEVGIGHAGQPFSMGLCECNIARECAEVKQFRYLFNALTRIYARDCARALACLRLTVRKCVKTGVFEEGFW
jgi:hypothetical protein